MTNEETSAPSPISAALSQRERGTPHTPFLRDPNLDGIHQKTLTGDGAVALNAEAHLRSLTGSNLYDSVRTLMHTGRTDDAVDRCLTIIEAEPLEAEHHCLLALVFLESDHPDAAITSLRRAIYCDPDNLTAFYMWWLVGVRYKAVNAGRAAWAQQHLLRLVAHRDDGDLVPLFGRVTVGDVRYMLQCEWSAVGQ